jgi:hypothetical protein
VEVREFGGGSLLTLLTRRIPGYLAAVLLAVGVVTLGIGLLQA